MSVTTTPPTGKPEKARSSRDIVAQALAVRAGAGRRPKSHTVGIPVSPITTPERIESLRAILSEIPGVSCAAQRARMLAAMERLGHITTFEAMRYLDCFDPRPRKLELVARGHHIELLWIRAETESGKVHRIGAYFKVREGSQCKPG